MKKIIINTLACLILIGVFSNCTNNNEDLQLELTMQEKVAILETGEWLLKGFEETIMHTFKDGEEFTYYGDKGEFKAAIPGTKDYWIEDDKLFIDFNFGNVFSYHIKMSCNNNIIELIKDGEVNKTLLKRSSNYKECFQ